MDMHHRTKEWVGRKSIFAYALSYFTEQESYCQAQAAINYFYLADRNAIVQQRPMTVRHVDLVTRCDACRGWQTTT